MINTGNRKKAVLITVMLTAILLAGGFQWNTAASHAAATPKWETAYSKVLKNWKTVENYADLSYLKQYFGSDYQFDRYYLYDLDKNGTPELFLYSTTMELTEILTYNNNKKKLIALGYQSISKINKTKKEIIVFGHWHGAGGSGTKEWSAYKISGNQLKMTYYIDYMNGNYDVYDSDWNSLGGKSRYDQIYKEHIKSATSVKSFRKYKLSDRTGIVKYKNKPKSTSIVKLTAKSKGFQVKWKKGTTKTKGYQIRYASNSKFKNAKTVTIAKKSATTKRISKLKAKKKYYVKVRVYNTAKVNGKSIKIYSGWTKAKAVTTKK